MNSRTIGRRLKKNLNPNLKKPSLLDHLIFPEPSGLLGKDEKEAEPITPPPFDPEKAADFYGFSFTKTEGSDVEQSPSVTPFSSPPRRIIKRKADISAEEAEKSCQRLLGQIIDSSSVKNLRGKSKQELTEEEKNELSALLGNVDFKQAGYLFLNTDPRLSKLSQDFLTGFFEQHKKLLLTLQKKKMGKTDRFNMPGCITFALLQSGPKFTCLIAVSRSANPNDDSTLVQALQSFALAFNSSSMIRCEVVAQCNPAYHQLLEQLSNNLEQQQAKNAQRICAEKSLTWELAKQMYRDPRLVVAAVYNYALFPYQDGVKYPKDGIVAPPVDKNGKSSTIVRGFILQTWTCCDNCKANSSAFYGFLAGIKNQARAEVELAKTDFSLLSTPDTYGVRTRTMLLSPPKTKGTESKENSPLQKPAAAEPPSITRLSSLPATVHGSSGGTTASPHSPPSSLFSSPPFRQRNSSGVRVKLDFGSYESPQGNTTRKPPPSLIATEEALETDEVIDKGLPRTPSPR